jgi:hypothetical protein
MFEVSPPLSSLLLPLLPPLLPPLELGVVESVLLPPQPALNRTDPKASARVSESTFRNIAMLHRWLRLRFRRRSDTCDHMKWRRFFEFSGAAKVTKIACNKGLRR